VTALEFLANALRFIGFLVTIVGLWLSAGGMRVVVSGRLDERRKSAKSLRIGLSTLTAGIVLFVGGTYLLRWAHGS
jgi:O-antigen/teichoic acid export membrane protein